MTNRKLWLLTIILFFIGMRPVGLAVFIFMELEIENLKKKVADLENSSRN